MLRPRPSVTRSTGRRPTEAARAVELLASGWGMAWVCAIVLFAGVAHGLTGFGFPIISTPMVALATDVRSAVVVTLLPNIVVNLISALRGAQWRANLARHVAMPLALRVVAA